MSVRVIVVHEEDGSMFVWLRVVSSLISDPLQGDVPLRHSPRLLVVRHFLLSISRCFDIEDSGSVFNSRFRYHIPDELRLLCGVFYNDPVDIRRELDDMADSGKGRNFSFLNE